MSSKKVVVEEIMPAQSHNRTINSSSNGSSDLFGSPIHESAPTKLIVGLKIRELRNQHRFSLRILAERSGLNINTLSLIENGKSSPSVGTLQQLARAMDVPITAFFESEPISKQIVFTGHDHRPGATFNNAYMQNLGKDLADNAVQPFIVTLDQGAGSGERLIVHTGHEFVYCMNGRVNYVIDHKEYSLAPGDSIVFEAHLPHQWKNTGDGQSQIILVLYPADQHEELGGRHFINE
jgi:transcriptional regulator with XRE-family HTH domain